MACVAWTSSAADLNADYVGSFTHQRVSDSGHVYIYELRIWGASSSLHGVLLIVQGLEGGGIQPVVEPILAGTLSQSGTVEIKTKWHSFNGTLAANRLNGVLKQGSETIWGGKQGSNDIELRVGTSLPKIQEKPLKTVRAVEDWVTTLQ
jgi:hypothetical protein